MQNEVYIEVVRNLSASRPAWVVLVIVLGILSFKSPQILKELFAGLRGLMLMRNQRLDKKSRAKNLR
jgi:hypothetical protein